MSIVTILSIGTYELNKEYVPEYDARNCMYFIPIIIWRRTPVVAKQWYDNEYDIVEGSLSRSGADIGTIRTAQSLINKITGTIKLTNYHQTNLQSVSTWFVNPSPVSEIGLLGIIQTS